MSSGSGGTGIGSSTGRGGAGGVGGSALCLRRAAACGRATVGGFFAHADIATATNRPAVSDTI